MYDSVTKGNFDRVSDDIDRVSGVVDNNYDETDTDNAQMPYDNDNEQMPYDYDNDNDTATCTIPFPVIVLFPYRTLVLFYCITK